jgi:hypothetical protein
MTAHKPRWLERCMALGSTRSARSPRLWGSVGPRSTGISPATEADHSPRSATRRPGRPFGSTTRFASWTHLAVFAYRVAAWP